MTELDRLSSAAISATLGARAALRIECLNECDSTNERALAHLRAGGATPFAITAEAQSAGRGRRGAHWVTTPGDAIALTLGWRYAGPLRALAGLSLAVGVAVATALDALDLHGIRLKWPNDLLFGDAKLGGVLIETVPGHGGLGIAIGIGLNVRHRRGLAQALRRPVAALDDIAAELPARNVIAGEILASTLRYLAGFEQDGFAAYRAQWNALHAWEGRQITVRIGTADPVGGVARGVDQTGALLVATAHGIAAIHTGDVALAACESNA